MMAAAMVVALAACSGDNTNQESDDASPIVIGTSQSLTGDLSSVGVSVRAGAEYAIEVINENGGVNGRELRLEARDDQSKTDQAVVAFNQLAGDVDIFMGPGGGAQALAVLDIVERQQIPMVGPASTVGQVEPIRDYVFQVPSSSSDVAEQLLNFYESQGYTEVFGVVNTEEGSISAAWTDMTASMAERGIELVGTAEVGFATTDYSAAIAQARSSAPDVVMAWVAGPPGVAFITQYQQALPDLPVTFSNAVAADYFIVGGGDAVDGAFIASPLGSIANQLPESGFATDVQEMVDGFADANGGTQPDQFVQTGYATIQVIAAAIEKAGSTDSAAIQEALSTLETDTILGPIVYSADNHAGPGPDFVAISQIVDNALVAEPFTLDTLTRTLE